MNESQIRIPKSQIGMKEWISLNMTPGVGPGAATKLLQRFGSAASVFHARRAELESLRIKPETIESIIKREFHEKADEELERVKSLGGDILLLDDGSYPALLCEIDDPPITLYVRGDWKACFDQPCVAVIGSRMCSTYGENAAEMLSRAILRHAAYASFRGWHAGSDTAAPAPELYAARAAPWPFSARVSTGAYPKKTLNLSLKY